MLSFQEFKEFYLRYNSFPNNIYINKKKNYNERQLQERYKKYCGDIEKKDKKIQEIVEKNKERYSKKEKTQLQVLRDKTLKRDLYKCRLLRILNEEEKKELYRNSNNLHKKLDLAHILPRGKYPEYKYEEWNVCILNHYSHLMLDWGKNPLSGKVIDKEETIYWWKRILGKNINDIPINNLK